MYPTTDATESRFVPLEANFEYLTQHQNTKQTVDFSRLKARDPFVKAQPDPDYNPKIAKSHVAIVRLANSKGHDFDGLFKKPFQVPDSLDLISAHSAFQHSSKGRTEPVLFRMEKSQPRDNSIYPLIKGDLRKLNFNQNLPS